MEADLVVESHVPTSPIEALWVARYDYDRGELLQRHRHPFHQLIYVIGGRASAEVGRSTVELSRGTILLATAGKIHSLQTSGDSPLQTYDTKFAVHDSVLSEDLERVPYSTRDHKGTTLHLIETLHREGDREHRWNRIACNAILTQVVIGLIRASTPGETGPVRDPLTVDVADPTVKQAISFISANYMQDITVDEIAGNAGFSRQHLARVFHEACESTPHDYLLRYRIHKAKELLRVTSLSIKQITHEVGFRSLHHFTRAFHAVVGAPPGQWRKIEVDGIRKDINVSPEFENVYVLPPKHPGDQPEVRVAGRR